MAEPGGRIAHCSSSSTPLGSLSSSLTSKSFPSGRRSSSMSDVHPLLPLLFICVLLPVVFFRRSNRRNTIMENGNEKEYENDDKHELSPLLLVPMMDEAQNAKKSRGGKCFVALLLLVVSATMAAAASTGLHPIVSAFPALVGHSGKQGDWCDGFWFDACGDKLSCFMGGNSNYCVPMGQEGACCGFSWGNSAAGIDCLAGLSCDSRTVGTYHNTVRTCRPTNEGSLAPGKFAEKGSCNVNTGEPANTLIECTFTYEG